MKTAELRHLRHQKRKQTIVLSTIKHLFYSHRGNPQRAIMTLCQRGRRNLSPAWKVELELGNKADLIVIGKANMSAGGGDKRSESAKSGLSQNDKPDPLPPVNTRVEIAKAAGVSTGQVGMAEQVNSRHRH